LEKDWASNVKTHMEGKSSMYAIENPLLVKKNSSNEAFCYCVCAYQDLMAYHHRI
jgi:hypothetical protein